MAVDGEEQIVEFGFDECFEYRASTLDSAIIDGRNSASNFSFQDPVESNSITLTLESCNRTIVTPYFLFLKMIGWRKWSSTTSLHESLPIKAFNYAFPFIAFSILLITFSQQVLWCFDRAVLLTRINHHTLAACVFMSGLLNTVRVHNPESNGSFMFIECETHIASAYVIPDVIILSSYLFGLYIFRYVYPEYLVSLIEKVFLNYTTFHGKYSQKHLLFWLRMLLVIGFILMLYSMTVNVLRMSSLRLLERDTYIAWFTSYNETYLTELYSMGNPPPTELLGLRISFFIISFIGLALTDFFYIATMINYAFQCQLIFCAINATVSRLSNRHVEVDDAIKEVKTLQDFLKVLNGKFSSLVSLQLFVFIGALISTFREVMVLENHEVLAIITGICAVLEWSFFLILIIVQSVRVTLACGRIKQLGLELRTRPFVHTQTKQLDLDSFLIYSSSITMDARLVHIPMKPLFVIPVLFASGLYVMRNMISSEFIQWI